ncbi:Adenylyltransferase and sulfurtransferase MOCS3-1 [Babesia sp. Xinjiang]|uniref:Adenylyltransferase and sulfurtransferase MOCS3-1 n=1 Tax=Babesia sp. Xinjiang TaxID=462227 RepID=UPI000A219374|nr:Adenylyltransferase and sulfurtransferase MOCS3-1 [Babesia sp. Xinjiang]ORM39799.1 Adenylyltransferase and sulfurtransferase MOCS3-1 [Babesia sp. Xinjiang]
MGDSNQSHKSVDACIKRAQTINAACPPINGCLAEGKRNDMSRPIDDILENRVPWAPKRREKKELQKICTSRDIPFCTALSKAEADRLGPQFIALQKCDPRGSAEYAVDATMTCAVLVIGAGGLGSPLLMYLAAGGVGIIGVMDGDVVEVSNLHRQIIHDEENEGMNKALSARRRMMKLNSKGTYIAYECFFGADEAETVLPKYDIVVDATDNPQTRYIINDACVKYNKTLVIASSIGTQGQLMVFNRTNSRFETPCFRCISPLEDNPFITSIRGACSFAGVLGSIPGVFGCLQATEVLKLAAGVNDAVLAPGRMITYDTTHTTKPFRTVQLNKNPKCTVCGITAQDVEIKMLPWSSCSINEVVDDTAISHESFWRIYMKNIHQGAPLIANVRLDACGPIFFEDGEERIISLVDVRPKEHYALCHITGASNWPLSEMVDDLAMLDEAKSTGSNSNVVSPTKTEELIYKRCIGRMSDKKLLILFICFLGNSSRIATQTLRKAIKLCDEAQKTAKVACYSVAGGCRALRTKLGLPMPLS